MRWLDTLSPYLTCYSRQAPVPVSDVAALVAGGCGCPGEAATFAVEQAAVSTAPLSALRWEGPIGMEGELTGDGRLVDGNALRWENLPIPFRHAPVDNGAHNGAMAVGRIMTIERRDGGVIWGTGDYDENSPEGLEAFRQAEQQITRGVSMDLDDVDWEIRVAKELLDSGDADPMESEGDIASAKGQEVDEEGRVTVVAIASDDEVMVTTDARIRAATQVQIPAFAGALIRAWREGGAEAPVEADVTPAEQSGTVIQLTHREPPALVAGAAPAEPPKEWFGDPGLTEPTPVTVTADGRIFGHLAAWGTCHVAYPGQCVAPPSSEAGYRYFRTGSVLTAEGDEVAVGRVTMDTLHADRDASPAATMAHYEQTGRQVAYVAAGEDGAGIWVAGALRSTVTPDQVRLLRASPLSGDWRRIGSGLELVAALAVNTPGFPIPRPQGLVASGAVQSLVASGMIAPRLVLAPNTPGALSDDDLGYLRRLAARERARATVVVPALTPQVEKLATRVRGQAVAQLAARVRSAS